jgi:5-methylcytosine-specific restriction enzyme A
MGRLYDRRRWRRVRLAQLRAEPLCRLCRERGRAEPAVDVDHIKALADGGEPFDFDNLRSLCHACHSRVTRAWRTGGEPPVKGCTADGFPLNPRHWWHGK